MAEAAILSHGRSQDFYAALEAVIEAGQSPKTKPRAIDLSEGGVLTGKRLSLRVVQGTRSMSAQPRSAGAFLFHRGSWEQCLDALRTFRSWGSCFARS